MTMILIIAGAALCFISIIAGVFSGSFGGFIIMILSVLPMAFILWGLAAVLDRVQGIEARQMETDRRIRELLSLLKEDTVCEKCRKKYDSEYTSCPHCGHVQSAS